MGGTQSTYSILQVANGVTEVEQRQRHEERNEDVDEEASEDIVGRTPESDETSTSDDSDLVPDGHSICKVGVSLVWRIAKVRLTSRRLVGLLDRLLLYGLRLQLNDLVLDLLELFGFLPKVSPVAISDSLSCSCSDCLQHVLRHVDIGRALGSSLYKVVTDEGAVRTDVTEVDGLAATLQEEMIELLELQNLAEALVFTLSVEGELHRSP